MDTKRALGALGVQGVQGFWVQFSNRPGILDSNFKKGKIQDSNFKKGKIQISTRIIHFHTMWSFPD